MKLEVGKTYRDAKGNVVKIVRGSEEIGVFGADDNGGPFAVWYLPDGLYESLWPNCPASFNNRLVEEIVEPVTNEV